MGNDRRRPGNPRYWATLATGGVGTGFTATKVSTAPSHPKNSVFFQARVPGCLYCTHFHGDYVSVAYGADGAANAVWTDMRDHSPFGPNFLQFIYFARVP